MTKRKNSELAPGEIRIMELLRDHPFLSRRQMELLLHRTCRMVRLNLRTLKDRGWVQRHNARQPWMYTRSLFSLTPLGIQAMANRMGMAEQDYARQAGLDLPRLERLMVMMERVFQVRTFLLWLQQSKPNWEWAMPYWDVEVGKLFNVGDKSFKLPFHG